MKQTQTDTGLSSQWRNIRCYTHSISSTMQGMDCSLSCSLLQKRIFLLLTTTYCSNTTDMLKVTLNQGETVVHHQSNFTHCTFLSHPNFLVLFLTGSESQPSSLVSEWETDRERHESYSEYAYCNDKLSVFSNRLKYRVAVFILFELLVFTLQE